MFLGSPLVDTLRSLCGNEKKKWRAKYTNHTFQHRLFKFWRPNRLSCAFKHLVALSAIDDTAKYVMVLSLHCMTKTRLDWHSGRGERGFAGDGLLTEVSG